MKRIIRKTVYFLILYVLVPAAATSTENGSGSREANEYAKSIETAYFNAKELEEAGYNAAALEAYAECVELFKEASQEYGSDIEELSGYAAESAFEIAEANFENYDRIRLVMPPKTLETNLSKRLELSKRLVDYYRYCVDLDVPEWTVAAEVRMGDVNYSFAEALCNAEPPPEIAPEKWIYLRPGDDDRILLEDMHRNYVHSLEEQAFPLYDQARAFYADALKTAGANNINDEWTRRAAEMSEEAEERSRIIRAGVFERREFESGDL
ncbi:MAG: hypothetical protein JSW52_05430 [Candidatus Coatesbacteria bacterium]|nr:MAG: hypothetical protein JSW52_05430 [Candidatus Coatesbacteria bacterium]